MTLPMLEKEASGAETNRVSSWNGIPITKLSKEELIEVIDYCGKEIINLRNDRDRWRNAGSVEKYLLG